MTAESRIPMLASFTRPKTIQKNKRIVNVIDTAWAEFAAARENGMVLELRLITYLWQ